MFPLKAMAALLNDPARPRETEPVLAAWIVSHQQAFFFCKDLTEQLSF